VNWRDWLRARRRADEDLAEELQAHLELQTRKHVAAGVDPEEARHRARLEFGGIEHVKETCREQRPGNFLESFFRDSQFAVRGIRPRPSSGANGAGHARALYWRKYDDDL